MAMVELEVAGEVLVARLFGEIDLRVADDLRRTLEQALDHFPVRHLVFDFEGVSFIDSTGLGVILGRYKRLANAGGRLGVTGLGLPVRRVLELSGILRVAREFGSRAEALEAFGGGDTGA
jgi:stage II sporulation protein AA (anti-sigma F factor antagonist)